MRSTSKSANQKLVTIKARLLEGMRDYLANSDDAGYTKTDIKKCDKILQEFVKHLGKLGSAASKLAVLACVKQAVLDLNALNNSVNGSLIETDQREDLCEYLLLTARSAGLNQEGDPTEEWREW
ncbi:MAG: hypothetical protein QM813_18345 [Verrucomicrobiota bacterium]